MLTVIGAGLPRTGTTSMKAALERLGFGPCYHMYEILSHPEQAGRWAPVAHDTNVDWGRVFAGYQATQDWPASHFWRELADAYPQAKVILTVRDPRAWYPSFRGLLTQAPAMSAGADEPGGPAAVLEQMRPVLARIGQEYFGIEWSPGDDVPAEGPTIAAFERHTEEVKQHLPAERLLVVDVRAGWAPLCAFLDVPVPDEPFPRLNDSEWMKQALARMQAEGEMPSPFEKQH